MLALQAHTAVEAFNRKGRKMTDDESRIFEALMDALELDAELKGEPREADNPPAPSRNGEGP
jgi:hypothetical protein